VEQPRSDELRKQPSWDSVAGFGVAVLPQHWEGTERSFCWGHLVSSSCRILLFKNADIFVNTDKVGTNVHIRINKSKMDTGVGFFILNHRITE